MLGKGHRLVMALNIIAKWLTIDELHYSDFFLSISIAIMSMFEICSMLCILLTHHVVAILSRDCHKVDSQRLIGGTEIKWDSYLDRINHLYPGVLQVQQVCVGAFNSARRAHGFPSSVPHKESLEI